MAIERGAPTAPSWVNILEACEQWGKMPWEITKTPAPIIWWLRFTVYRREQARIAKKQQRKAAQSGVANRHEF